MSVSSGEIWGSNKSFSDRRWTRFGFQKEAVIDIAREANTFALAHPWIMFTTRAIIFLQLAALFSGVTLLFGDIRASSKIDLSGPEERALFTSGEGIGAFLRAILRFQSDSMWKTSSSALLVLIHCIFILLSTFFITQRFTATRVFSQLRPWIVSVYTSWLMIIFPILSIPAIINSLALLDPGFCYEIRFERDRGKDAQTHTHPFSPSHVSYFVLAVAALLTQFVIDPAVTWVSVTMGHLIPPSFQRSSTHWALRPLSSRPLESGSRKYRVHPDGTSSGQQQQQQLSTGSGGNTLTVNRAGNINPKYFRNSKTSKRSKRSAVNILHENLVVLVAPRSRRNAIIFTALRAAMCLCHTEGARNPIAASAVIAGISVLLLGFIIKKLPMITRMGNSLFAALFSFGSASSIATFVGLIIAHHTPCAIQAACGSATMKHYELFEPLAFVAGLVSAIIGGVAIIPRYAYLIKKLLENYDEATSSSDYLGDLEAGDDPNIGVGSSLVRGMRQIRISSDIMDTSSLCALADDLRRSYITLAIETKESLETLPEKNPKMREAITTALASYVTAQRTIDPDLLCASAQFTLITAKWRNALDTIRELEGCIQADEYIIEIDRLYRAVLDRSDRSGLVALYRQLRELYDLMNEIFAGSSKYWSEVLAPRRDATLELPVIAGDLSTKERKCEHLIESMLNAHPQNTSVLEAYAAFLEMIKRDLPRASAIRAQLVLMMQEDDDETSEMYDSPQPTKGPPKLIGHQDSNLTRSEVSRTPSTVIPSTISRGQSNFSSSMQNSDLKPSINPMAATSHSNLFDPFASRQGSGLQQTASATDDAFGLVASTEADRSNTIQAAVSEPLVPVNAVKYSLLLIGALSIVMMIAIIITAGVTLDQRKNNTALLVSVDKVKHTSMTAIYECRKLFNMARDFRAQVSPPLDPDLATARLSDQQQRLVTILDDLQNAMDEGFLESPIAKNSPEISRAWIREEQEFASYVVTERTTSYQNTTLSRAMQQFALSLVSITHIPPEQLISIDSSSLSSAFFIFRNGHEGLNKLIEKSKDEAEGAFSESSVANQQRAVIWVTVAFIISTLLGFSIVLLNLYAVAQERKKLINIFATIPKVDVVRIHHTIVANQKHMAAVAEEHENDAKANNAGLGDLDAGDGSVRFDSQKTGSMKAKQNEEIRFRKNRGRGNTLGSVQGSAVASSSMLSTDTGYSASAGASGSGKARRRRDVVQVDKLQRVFIAISMSFVLTIVLGSVTIAVLSQIWTELGYRDKEIVNSGHTRSHMVEMLGVADELLSNDTTVWPAEFRDDLLIEQLWSVVQEGSEQNDAVYYGTAAGNGLTDVRVTNLRGYLGRVGYEEGTAKANTVFCREITPRQDRVNTVDSRATNATASAEKRTVCARRLIIEQEYFENLRTVVNLRRSNTTNHQAMMDLFQDSVGIYENILREPVSNMPAYFTDITYGPSGYTTGSFKTVYLMVVVAVVFMCLSWSLVIDPCLVEITLEVLRMQAMITMIPPSTLFGTPSIIRFILPGSEAAHKRKRGKKRGFFASLFAFTGSHSSDSMQFADVTEAIAEAYEAIDSPVVILDDRGRVVFASQVWLKMTSLAPEDVLDRFIGTVVECPALVAHVELIGEKARQSHSKGSSQLDPSDIPVVADEGTVTHSSGDKIPVNVRVATIKPIYGSSLALNAQPIQFTVVLRDLTTERKQAAIAKVETEKARRLLGTMVPPPIARRLQRGEKIIADHHESATILFCDLVGFTSLARGMNAALLGQMLHDVFAGFDHSLWAFRLLKVKNNGDQVLAICGIYEDAKDPLLIANPSMNPAVRTIFAGLALLSSLRTYNATHGTMLEARVGIHTGPLIAGVISSGKPSFDILGESVNTASRLESSGVAGRVQVSRETYVLAAEWFNAEERLVYLKGLGDVEAYLIDPSPKKAVPPDFLAALNSPIHQSQTSQAPPAPSPMHHGTTMTRRNSIQSEMSQSQEVSFAQTPPAMVARSWSQGHAIRKSTSVAFSEQSGGPGE